MSDQFWNGDAIYQKGGDDYVYLLVIITDDDYFCVPAEVTSPDGKVYKDIRFIRKQSWFVNKNGKIPIVTFDEASLIENIPTSFISSSNSIFTLPPKIKRIRGDNFYVKNWPIIVLEHESKFVSVTGKRSLMNHHPLELLLQDSHRSRLSIRETTKIIGYGSYYDNKLITSVVVPSSVELIGDASFFKCSNLRSVTFKKNSRLKRIEEWAFKETAISHLIIPSSVEIIESSAFEDCNNLALVLFEKNSKLKNIGPVAFASTKNLKSIEIPANVELIGSSAFSGCSNLSNISFSKNSRLKVIGSYAFSMTSIEVIEIPASVEKIMSFAFNNCLKLSSVIFAGDSIPKFIDRDAFKKCPCESQLKEMYS